MADLAPTRRLPAAERREVVLSSAGELFGRFGYDGVTLDTVAATAGVTKPILYRHFESKEDLYLALLDRHRRDLDSFAPLVPQSGTPVERLTAVIDAWLAYAETHTYTWRMLFRDGGGGPRIAAFRSRVQARARAVLAAMIRGLALAEISDPEVEPLAELLRAGMASTVLWWADSREVPREAVLAALVRVWLGVLAPSEARD
jgi:AcrR family transcriptional regulator